MPNFAGVGMPPQQQSTQVPLNPQGQPYYPQQPQAPQPPQQGFPQNYGFQQPQQGNPQQQAQAQAQRLALKGDEILDGEGIPPELRGRKASEVMRIYSALADDFITRKRQQQGQGGQSQQQGQPTQQQQQNFQRQQRRNFSGQSPQNQQQQGQDGEGGFWQTPDENIKNIVRQVVQEAVQPFQQQTLAQSSRNALQQARERIPDFQQLEPDIMETIKGSSQEALANPEYWEHAADLARGRRARQNGGFPPPQTQGQGSQQPIFPSNAVPATQQIPQPQMPQPQNPMAGMPQGYPQQGFPRQPQRPQTQQFFTEAPTAPSVYQNTHMGALNPAQQQVARLAGISPEQYQAWAAIQQQGRGV